MAIVRNAKIKKQGKAPITCYDCGKNIEFNGEEIKKGVFLIYDDYGEKIKVLKCQTCYEKNSSLTNFRTCEVYSRVVGYLRPVQQWNKGKQQEFQEREEYKLREKCC